jgi:hypothetical protein
LLVPSWTASGEERRLQDISKLLDRVARRAGLEKGALRSRLFRHTYCAARLQTLDRGHKLEIESPAPTEVEAGDWFPESGRPDSNRRRPAWEAGILPLNYARETPEI